MIWLLEFLLIGLIAGWAAGKIMKGGGWGPRWTFCLASQARFRGMVNAKPRFLYGRRANPGDPGGDRWRNIFDLDHTFDQERLRRNVPRARTPLVNREVVR